MTSTLLAFVPVAAVLSLAPGPATALVVRNAARGGRRHALHTTVGNSVGVLAWGCFAAAGVAAVVAASAELFTVMKLVGAAFLVYLGVQSLRGRAEPARPRPLEQRSALRDGLVTSIANGTIVCPCHGSKYAIADGSVKDGPAPAPLPAKTVKVDGDNLVLG